MIINATKAFLNSCVCTIRTIPYRIALALSLPDNYAFLKLLDQETTPNFPAVKELRVLPPKRFPRIVIRARGTGVFFSGGKRDMIAMQWFFGGEQPSSKCQMGHFSFPRGYGIIPGPFCSGCETDMAEKAIIRTTGQCVFLIYSIEPRRSHSESVFRRRMSRSDDQSESALGNWLGRICFRFAKETIIIPGSLRN